MVMEMVEIQSMLHTYCRSMTVNSAYGATAIDAACLQIDATTINAAHILQIDGSHSAHGGTMKEKWILYTYCRSIMVFQACLLYA